MQQYNRDEAKIKLSEQMQKRSPGSGKGEILFLAANFDTLPKGFEEYVLPCPSPIEASVSDKESKHHGR